MNFSEVCIKRNDYWVECRCPQGYFSCNEDIMNWMTLNRSIHCFWDMKYYANITQYERYHEWLAKSKTTLPATSTTTTSTSSITFTNTTTSTTKNIAEPLPAAGASTISDDSSSYREAIIEARKKTAFKLFMLSTCMACVLFVQLIFIRMLRNAYRQQYEEYVRNQMELQAKQALSSEAPEAVIGSSGSSSNSSEKRPRFAPMNKRSAEQLSQLLKSAVTPAAAKSPMQLEEYLPGIDSYVPASKRNHKD
ncbi:hypothetical protein GCK32_007142 [Trichostrongylus colubriformis]|uniref:Uncharacterized protein n=1 Tax=Trichostrongylus colubriformis TaxID=6319 RepID=A0AAN8IPE1_TRICO